MLSIVIPCYNEASIIEDSVDKVVNFMKSVIVDYELLLINDGSTDNSEQVFKELSNKYESVRDFTYKPNKGKGYAVNYGFKRIKGDLVLFMDADLSTDLNSIKSLLNIALDRTDNFCIIGSRKLENSVILNNNNKIRKLMSKYCTLLVNKLFKLGVSDSQCGFKCFDRGTANLLISNQMIFGWAFDVEYILLLRLYNIDIIEIPVVWENEERSSVNPLFSSLSYIRELIRIKTIHRGYRDVRKVV